MPNNITSYKTLLPILLTIGLIWVIYSLQFLSQGVFWDLGIYQKAVETFLAGGDPYAIDGYLSFVYHPLVLRFMALFGPHLSEALKIAYLASIFFFIASLGKNRSWWLASFLAFAYCGIGTIALGSGNVTSFFHLFFLGLLLRNISSESSSYKTFIVAAVLFSLVKPYMLAYLLIPLLASWYTPKRKSTFFLSILAGIFFFALLVISSLHFESEFQSFLRAVQGQTLGKHDLGYGVVMFFYEYYSSAGTLIYRAFALHFMIIGALSLLIFWLSKRHGLIKSPLFVLILYFLLTILNPRLKVYDLFPALVALFIFTAYYAQSNFVKVIFVIAYGLSLSQLKGTVFFVHSGVLSSPLNVYYLTIALVFFSLMPTLLRRNSLAI